MSPLRLRMIEDMNLAGLAAATQSLYLRAVYRLAAHYRRSPQELSEEEVRCYLVSPRDQGAARGTFKTSHYGIQFYSLLAGNWGAETGSWRLHPPPRIPALWEISRFFVESAQLAGFRRSPGTPETVHLKSRGHFGGLSLEILCARPDRATFKPGDLPMTMEMLGLMALVLVVGGVVAACFFAKNVDKAARLHRPAGEMARHH